MVQYKKTGRVAFMTLWRALQVWCRVPLLWWPKIPSAAGSMSSQACKIIILIIINRTYGNQTGDDNSKGTSNYTGNAYNNHTVCHW